MRRRFVQDIQWPPPSFPASLRPRSLPRRNRIRSRSRLCYKSRILGIIVHASREPLIVVKPQNPRIRKDHPLSLRPYRHIRCTVVIKRMAHVRPKKERNRAMLCARCRGRANMVEQRVPTCAEMYKEGRYSRAQG
jgi:hypothetical protein